MILRGIEDIPAIAEDRCHFCGGELPKDPWFAFIRENGQMYQVPKCDDCSRKDSPADGAVVVE
jgi:NAD-dependent SIR2 family protein deacetylase